MYVAQPSQRFKWESNEEVKGMGLVRECVIEDLLILQDHVLNFLRPKKVYLGGPSIKFCEGSYVW
jgi:hypothetical protein